MTLQQLRYFLAAAEHGSFSAAAGELRVAQPSVSEQVRRLEKELGVPLFGRVGRGLVLTEAGRAFRPHAEAAMRAVVAAQEAVAGVRDISAGTASFGAFGTALHYVLGDLVQDFRERYPSVRLRIVGENSSEVAERVRDGRLEAGLVVLPIDDSGLEVRPVMREPVLFVSSRPDRVRVPMSMTRLARIPLVLAAARYGTLDPTRRQLAERAQRAGVRIEPAIEVEELAERARARGARPRRHGRARRAAWRAGTSRAVSARWPSRSRSTTSSRSSSGPTRRSRRPPSSSWSWPRRACAGSPRGAAGGDIVHNAT